ncbi:MAG: hypothetical protein V1714_05660 [Pseudomonadota bacterium]
MEQEKVKHPRVVKTEVAAMVALKEMGHSKRSISRLTGRRPATVRHYLGSEIALNDPEIRGMVETILAYERADLAIIGDKARSHLHKLLDGGEMRAIETIAAMDRAFQQRRLIEGLSTANIGVVAKVVELDSEIDQLRAELKAMDAEEA